MYDRKKTTITIYAGNRGEAHVETNDKIWANKFARKGAVLKEGENGVFEGVINAKHVRIYKLHPELDDERKAQVRENLKMARAVRTGSF